MTQTAAERRAKKALAERRRCPLAERFKIALDHARKGRNVRDCLEAAGILGPLLRGEE